MRLNFQECNELKVVSRIIPEAKSSGIVRLNLLILSELRPALTYMHVAKPT